MTTAYNSLKSGLEADISIMASNNFIDTHADIIEDIFLCIKIVRLGRYALNEKIWLEALKMYGFNSYSNIIDHMEKQARSRDKATISIARNFSLEKKKEVLKKYAFQIPEFRLNHFSKKSITNQQLEYA